MKKLGDEDRVTKSPAVSFFEVPRFFSAKLNLHSSPVSVFLPAAIKVIMLKPEHHKSNISMNEVTNFIIRGRSIPDNLLMQCQSQGFRCIAFFRSSRNWQARITTLQYEKKL